MGDHAAAVAGATLDGDLHSRNQPRVAQHREELRRLVLGNFGYARNASALAGL
jgi:hypothetical protein